MTEEKIHKIGDQEVKETDLTPEQHHHKNHVISLRNKIAKLQFEIDDLMPSLTWHENALVNTTKKQSEETLESETKTLGET
jgi:uncharacterized protein YlxW (UPF0749 family)|tara:strand:- start:5 stop:247 length:243 start_codon:yes stop_codon:yes gene_type:complete